MIKKLHVKNFAIIEDITLEFNKGLTVLTGQTGAGKSLIIDSISLLLGKRSDTDMIRYGEDKAIIEGYFDSTSEIETFLSVNDLPLEKELYIYRDITKNKSNVKINGQNVSIQILKSLGNILGDVHIQNDTFRLFTKEKYVSLIDPIDNDEFEKIFNKYQMDFHKYQDAYNKYITILNNSKTEQDKLEYYSFAYNEISEHNFHENEDKELIEKAAKLKNFDKIFQAIKSAINSLENEYFSLDNIYDSASEIKQIAKFDKEYEDIYNRINDSYYNLNDSLSDLKKNINSMDYSEDELNEINSRIVLIDNLKLKYHLDLNGLIKYQNELKLKLDMANNYDEVLKESYDELNSKFKALIKSANDLTLYRMNRSNLISKSIEALCQDLELPHTRFKIEFAKNIPSDPLNKDIFKDDGIDDVEFMISTNLGEPLKPLSKVASGGEMSRIMLAFKAFFVSESKLSFIVFDEIDTGVSGSVALEIAKKMKQISSSCQVLAITHLPQVAASADNQLLIYKEELDGRTFANVKLMSKEERILQIARMISGQKISTYAISQAEDLLNN